MEGCGALVQLDCYQYTGKDVCYKIYYDITCLDILQYM